MTSSSDKRIRKAVIPVAGKGTRLYPLTKAIPKELIPLGRKPVLEHIVDEAVAAGITEILFVISQEKTAIKSHFGDGADGIRFDYTFQIEQKGLADAVYCAKEWVGNDHFSLILGDSPITSDSNVLPFNRVLDCYQNTPAKGVIIVEAEPDDELYRFGVVKPIGEIGPSFEIDGLVEKPKPGTAPSNFTIAGRYAFDPMIFSYIEQTPIGANGELQITDSIGLMLNDGNPIWCVAMGENETRRDIGTFESYFEAFQIEIAKEAGK